MNDKKTRKFNLIDIIAVLLIAAVVVFLGYKMATRGSGEGEGPGKVNIAYTVKCEGVDASLYENCKSHLPSQLMAAGTLYDGQIESVVQEPFYVLDGSGNWVEDPYHVNLIFTATCAVPGGEVMTTKIGDQEVRVGKTDYILKSEYIEFDKCVITSVTWNQ
ncbi:MAG: DUF4330 domain-containing protein [Oscillibacter sp.]